MNINGFALKPGTMTTPDKEPTKKVPFSGTNNPKTF